MQKQSNIALGQQESLPLQGTQLVQPAAPRGKPQGRESVPNKEQPGVEDDPRSANGWQPANRSRERGNHRLTD